jgi:hypothetical protein
LPKATQEEFLSYRERSGENKKSTLGGLRANRDNPIGSDRVRSTEREFGRVAKVA